MKSEKFLSILHDLLQSRKFSRCIFSSPLKKGAISKIVFTVFQGKSGKLCYQKVWRSLKKELHQTLDEKSLCDEIATFLPEYKQVQLYHLEGEFSLLQNGRGHKTLTERKSAVQMPSIPLHNHVKKRALDPVQFSALLNAFGWLDEHGGIKVKWRSKYEQVDALLQACLLEAPPQKYQGSTIYVVEVACGKAFLSLALIALYRAQGVAVTVDALDINPDVIRWNREMIKKLEESAFIIHETPLQQFQPKKPPHLLLGLHACNTLSDLVIEKLLCWDGSALLLAPCCHQELYKKIQTPSMEPILRWGILKERFASLATDALRALRLEAAGFKVTIQEFVSEEHSGKNLLIRAHKASGSNTEGAQKMLSAWEVTLF